MHQQFVALHIENQFEHDKQNQEKNVKKQKTPSKSKKYFQKNQNKFG